MSIYSSWSSCGTYSGIIHNVCLIILYLKFIAFQSLWSLADLIHSDSVWNLPHFHVYEIS